jgi:hypothetical protein
MRDPISSFDAVTSTQIPVTERILVRLSDILLASDEILGVLEETPPAVTDTARSVERSVRHVYDEVNELMKRIAD